MHDLHHGLERRERSFDVRLAPVRQKILPVRGAHVGSRPQNSDERQPHEPTGIGAAIDVVHGAPQAVQLP